MGFALLLLLLFAKVTLDIYFFAINLKFLVSVRAGLEKIM